MENPQCVYVSLLEKDTTREGRINKFVEVPEFEFEPGDNKEYKVESIQKSAIYVEKANKHLSGL